MKRMLAVVAGIALLALWGGPGGDGLEAGAQEANLSEVSREQFEAWMDELSNWGRWGDDDERGVLNLITAEKAAQAGALVQTGETVSLAHPIGRQPGEEPDPTNFGGAGYDPALIPFFRERDIALLGADIPQEGGNIPGVVIPIHTFTIVALGMNLLDNLALHELAETAARLNRWEFMLTVEPLCVERGAGSPVNPIAVF